MPTQHSQLHTAHSWPRIVLLSAGLMHSRCSVSAVQFPRVGPSFQPGLPFPAGGSCLPPASCTPSSPAGPFEDALKLHECSVAAGTAAAPLLLEDQWPSPPTRRAPIAPTEEQLRQEPWYHGQMSRRAAEKLLRADGDFLVRDSVTNPGQYVLTGMQAGQPKHLLLVDPEGVVRRGGAGRGRDGGEAWLGEGARAGLGDERGSFLRPFRFNDVLSRLQSPLRLQILFLFTRYLRITIFQCKNYKLF